MTVLEEEVVRAPIDLDGPALAHIPLPSNRLKALCGADLIGETAPSGYPHKCDRCWALFEYMHPAT